MPVPTLNTNLLPCDPARCLFKAIGQHTNGCPAVPINVPVRMPLQATVPVFLPDLGMVLCDITMESQQIDAQVKDADVGEVTRTEQERADEAAGDFAADLYERLTAAHDGAKTCDCDRCLGFRAISLMFQAEVAERNAWELMPPALRGRLGLSAMPKDPMDLESDTPAQRALEELVRRIADNAQTAATERAEVCRAAYQQKSADAEAHPENTPDWMGC